MIYLQELLGRKPVRKAKVDDDEIDFNNDDWKGADLIRNGKVMAASWGGKSIAERASSAKAKAIDIRRAKVRQLAKAGYNKTKIAQEVGCSYRVVQSDIEQMGITCVVGRRGPDPKGGGE